MSLSVNNQSLPVNLPPKLNDTTYIHVHRFNWSFIFYLTILTIFYSWWQNFCAKGCVISWYQTCEFQLKTKENRFLFIWSLFFLKAEKYFRSQIMTFRLLISNPEERCWTICGGQIWQYDTQWNKITIFVRNISWKFSRMTVRTKISWLRPDVKGQLILKGLFCVFNSSKKRTKNFYPSKLGQKFKFSSSLFGRIEDTKKTFRN